jgi:hypothetical protein
MRFLSAAALLICSAALSLAQVQTNEKLCDDPSSTTINRDDGVIVQKVVLSGGTRRETRDRRDSGSRMCEQA